MDDDSSLRLPIVLRRTALPWLRNDHPTTCPAGTVGVVNPASAMVKGGATTTTTLPVQVQSTGISTPNKLSPYRCVATVSATGPGGDTVGTNNTTQLVIDVLDKNDY